MRIGVDLHTLTNFMQGSRTYIYNLTKNLINIDRTNEYYLYFPRNLSPHANFALNQTSVHHKTIYPASRSIRLCITFPMKLAMDNVDLFHCQYMGPLFTPCPYIVTIHDIIHERYPKFYPRNLRILMKMFYPLSARRARRILTGSQFTKKEIVEVFKIPEEKISVIPYGVSADFRIIDDEAKKAEIKVKYGISSRYILFVGRVEPRKNIGGLINAYYALKERYGVKEQLVIVGMKDELFRNYDIDRDKIGPEVVFTGRVAQDDLPYLYSGSDLFAYPSFAEGFGLPVLEAMACGVPVVTSSTASLPEVVGDAGVMVDPGDEEDLAMAMNKVLQDQDLQQSMKARGLERAKGFTWQRTAERVLQLHQELLTG